MREVDDDGNAEPGFQLSTPIPFFERSPRTLHLYMRAQRAVPRDFILDENPIVVVGMRNSLHDTTTNARYEPVYEGSRGIIPGTCLSFGWSGITDLPLEKIHLKFATSNLKATFGRDRQI